MPAKHEAPVALALDADDANPLLPLVRHAEVGVLGKLLEINLPSINRVTVFLKGLGHVPLGLGFVPTEAWNIHQILKELVHLFVIDDLKHSLFYGVHS